MGDSLPLGHDRHPDPQRRELVVHPVAAEVVGRLFRLYADLGNLRRVEMEAARLGLRSKAEVSATGRTRDGSLFTRGQLHYLLTNPVYIGRIRRKELSYPGQHPAIIDAAFWDTVQAKLLAAQARPRGRSSTAAEARMLTGKLRDETCDPLTPTHTQRHGRRFAYYVWHRLLNIVSPFDLRRRGGEARIIGGEMIPSPDPVLQFTLAAARLWAGLIRSGTSLTYVARKTGQSEPCIRNQVVLAFRAPKIQAAILDGKQPPDLSLAKLFRDGIPTD